MPGKKNRHHRAYLLRCWQEGRTAAGEERYWRFLVEDVLGQRPQRGFDGLDRLVTFLQAEFAGEKNGSPARAWPADPKEEGGD
jgi:hypothetical protein